jgi:hypothetical protein
MRVLYLDSLFWLELIADTVLLWAAGKLCSVRRKPFRLLAAGLIGSGYSLLALFFPPAATFPGKAASLALMLLAAYGGEKQLWRPGLAYLFLCAVYGGVAAAVMLAAGRATARALVFSAGISMGVCALPFRFAGRRGGKCSLRLVGEGGEVTLTALRDTGDRLNDPFSGNPVVISSEEQLVPLFSPLQRQILAATAKEPPEMRMARLGKGFCLIPLRTVSGSVLSLSGKVSAVYQDGQALGPCRVVFSREPIRCEGCSAIIGGDGI